MMADLINRKSVIDVIHKTIFDFFDIVDDDDESPMTYKDEQLLTLNKAIVTKIKALPSADELTTVTEYCRKRNLVIITMESFRVLQAYYNRQNGMDGEQDG